MVHFHLAFAFLALLLAICTFTLSVTDISQNQKKKAQAMIYSHVPLRIMGMEQLTLLVDSDDAVESRGGPGLGTSADVWMLSPDGNLVLTTICSSTCSKQQLGNY